MNSQSLNVFIAGNLAGTLTQDIQGQLAFFYAGGYSGPPLSVSMPVSNRTYRDKQVRPYLFGLLPDDAAVRRALGSEVGASGNNPFALLRHYGLDCPGAIQICESGASRSNLQESLLPMSESDIAARLKKGRSIQEASWTDPHEHWSLGGQQSKFALRLKDGQWHKCLGAEATTHIFKPGISHLKHQALNEFVCMRLARACSIPAANVSFEVFENEPALIIERYDRYISPIGKVTRLHQEDFCQILGVLPDNKYTENGGPGASDLMGILSQTGNFSKLNTTRFCEMLFFNYLIGAPDAHAKNYSLLHGPSGEAVLAPLYDAASMFPYLREKEKMKTAMSIGGENKLGFLKRSNIEQFVASNGLEQFGLSTQACVGILVNLAERIIDSADAAFAMAAEFPGGSELRSQFEKPLIQHCKRTIERFS